jgi:hypothetical protein
VSLLSDLQDCLGANNQPFDAVFDRLGFPSGVSWQAALAFDWPEQVGQEPRDRSAGANVPAYSQAVIRFCGSGIGGIGVQKRAGLLAEAAYGLVTAGEVYHLDCFRRY